MKKIVLTLIIILSALNANAQDSAMDRIIRDAKRTAEWRIRSTINREIDRAIYDASNDAYRNRRARKQNKVWTCPCCHTRNKGNFCTHCGEQKPLELIPWTCPECHHHNKGGIYCETCGHSRLPETPKTEQSKEITLEELSRLNRQ